MARTAEQLRAMSENIKAGIIQLAFELKKVNDEIVERQQTHEAALENLKARHEAELAQLVADNEGLTELAEKNKAFISAVEKFIGE